MGKHALLSPSAASIWTICSPAARLAANIPDKGSSYADEGTLAHKLGELLILRLLKRIREQNFKIRLAQIKADKYYEDAMYDWAEMYATYVMQTYAKALKIDRGAMIFLETELNMERWVPEGFGTADILIMCDGYLWFIDLKYGKGVPVASHRNKQLMLYALGAVDIFYLFFATLKKISLTIYQPRIDNTSTYVLELEELLHWGNGELKEKAQKAFEGKGEFVPGDHCTFCRVRPQCRANTEYNLSLRKHEAKEVFKKPPLLTDEEIIEVLEKQAGLVSWAAAVKEYVLQQALSGKKFKGYKLVAGRSNRYIKNIPAAAKVLRQAGYKPAEIYQELKMRGIGELESLLGKDFGYYLNDYTEKPYGKPTLVPESDERPRYNKNHAAKEVFKSP